MAVKLSLSITQNSTNVTNNTSNVTVKATASWTYGSWNATGRCTGYIIIDGTKHSFSGITFNEGQSTSGSKVVMTKTVDVPHNSNGSKTLTCSASLVTGVSSGTIYADAEKALTVIPRKSTMKVASGTLGVKCSLTVTRQSSSFTHAIKAVCGNSTLYIKADGSTSTSVVKHGDCDIQFTPPDDWAYQNTTGTTVSVTFTITTYNGNTSLGSNDYKGSYTIPEHVKPICSLYVTDPTGHLDTYGDYVMGVSKISIQVGASEIYGSAIASYKTTINGRNYSSSKFTIDTPNDWGTFTITSTVTDKRGRSHTQSQNIRIVHYFKPTIKWLTVHRCDVNGEITDQGDHVKVLFDALVADLNSKNTASYTVEYKKTTESDYTSVVLTDYNNDLMPLEVEYIFEADTGSSYDVRVIATDNIGSGSKTTTVSTAFTIMHWLASGLGMAIGKIAELTGVLDIGFQTRFMGGILHPVLEPKTDLDDVLTPNTYVGANVSTYNYGHCPLTSGTFTLEVVGMGEDGQVKQRLTYCHKTECRAWERIYYRGSWSYDEDTDPTGGWVCVSDFGGTLLWSGVYSMSATQTATLSEPISKQRSGIVLVFSRYSSGVAQDYHFQTFFIPKYQVAAHPGNGHTFMLTTDGTFGLFAAKYLYINDDRIVGNAVNEAIGTGECGIKYTNNGFVLRHVIGV